MYNNNLSNIIDSGRQPYRAQEKRSPGNVTDNRDDLSLNEEYIMNKLFTAILITYAVSIPSAMAIGLGSNTHDPQGKINFTGHVYSSSCKIVNDDSNKNVKLKPVLSHKVNKFSSEQDQIFHIKVKDCYIHEKLIPKLAWVNNGNLTNEGYLQNNDANGAKNVALVLKDKNGRTIDLNDKSNRFEPENYQSIGHNDSPLTYTFSVGYIKPRNTHFWDQVTTGPVTAQANYSITYL
jgi:major type 1 subunit fimbrin (pilin)